MKLYVSGYNGGAKPSIGIFNMDHECIIEECWSGYVGHSSYLCAYEDDLFGISELEGQSHIHLFQRSNQGYTHTDTKIIEGGSLCHISYLQKNKVLVGACYEGGEVFTVRVGENGFGNMVSFIKQGGESETTTRAHCVVPNESETLVYSANIALDRIYSYMVNEGELVEKDQLTLPKGEGPRHILLGPGEDMLYVITEYSNKIHRIHSVDGKMTWADCVNTLPENFCGESYGSSLCMSADGRLIYAANRGANTIAVFHIRKDGSLSKVGDCPCFGDWPRHIALVNLDGYLAIANQKSNQVVLSKLDSKTGLLTEEVVRIEFENVSYVNEGI